MNQIIGNRGFLPEQDPLETVSDTDFRRIEQIGKELPDLIDSGKFREQFNYSDESGNFPKGFNWSDFLQSNNPRSVEAIFRLYCYFASAWVHARDYRNNINGMILPTSISRPLVRMAKQLGQPPILAYRSYCLNNWKRIDPSGPVELGNIALIQNFTREAKRDEDWFILIHVDIEAKFTPALQAINILNNTKKYEQICQCLEIIRDSFISINTTMSRMPEQCSPDIYYNKVRPYIFGFNGVVYDKCFDNEPQTYRGETGAQSTIVPATIAALGIRHKESMLTKHLNDMKNYMPSYHREFLKTCEHNGLQTKQYIKYYHDYKQYQDTIQQVFNGCVEEIVKFRQMHFDYAVQYIHKKVENPNGTGGTPYIEWLGELINETKSYLLKV